MVAETGLKKVGTGTKTPAGGAEAESVAGAMLILFKL